MLKRTARLVLPPSLQERLRARYDRRWGWRGARARRLAAPEPQSRRFGIERGLPIDRYYIEQFIRHFGGEEAPLGEGIRGRVLEVAERLYVRGPEAFAAHIAARPLPPVLPQVDHADVLDLSPRNLEATIVADLAGDAPEIPSDAFDCVICTQTLQFIYDYRAAVRTLRRVVRPGGVILATLPGISQVCTPELAVHRDLQEEDFPPGVKRPVDRWRFTAHGARDLFEEAFGDSEIVVESYGNALSAAGFLQGLSVRDLTAEELDRRDPDYPVVVGICAVRGGATGPGRARSSR
jgi:SAM-dependent methyltransferase